MEGERKISKTKKIVIAVIIVIIICTPLVYVYVIEWHYWHHSFDYDVRIEKVGPGNYTVIMPFPNYTDNYEYWNEITLDKITSPNITKSELIETQYGQGLKITASKNVLISISFDIYVPCELLTMENETENEHKTQYWIYSNHIAGTNLALKMSMSNDHVHSYKNRGMLFSWASGGGPYIMIPSYGRSLDLQMDWNQYEATKSEVIVN